MFHKNPFTKENAKSISTILAAVFAALGGTSSFSDQSAEVQIALYTLSIALFLLDGKRLYK